MLITCLAITTALWIAGKVVNGWPADIWPWRGPCQLAMVWALTLMPLTLLSAARSQAMEPMFGGLDRAIRLHRLLGPAAILLIILHVLLLIPIWLAQRRDLIGIFVPFYLPSRSVFDLFIIAFYGFILTGLLSYAGGLAYRRWRRLHQVNGLLFAVSAVPSLFVPGSISSFEPFRLWMAILTFAGLAAILHRFVIFRRWGPRFRYQVERIAARGGEVYDLIMLPTDRRMSYAPGKFVFVGVPGDATVGRDLHPFSLSSTPVRREMRISVHAVGMFTDRLRALPSGQPIDVYGPFGSFTLHSLERHQRVVCIGAGIGITPFLGMMAFEVTNDEQRQVWMYYVVHDSADAAYDDELRQVCGEAPSVVAYQLWCTAELGRITAGALHERLAGQGDYAVMLCGPAAFVADLSRQFRALGLPVDRVVAEGFKFR